MANGIWGRMSNNRAIPDVLNTWVHDPSLKKEFIGTYGIEKYKLLEHEAVDLFPTYAQHSTTMLKNFFSLSGLTT
jgi:hypothetical protein